jgi:hypothetical protein
VSVEIPESIDLEDEIAILWERNEDMARVEASLGDAKIVVESTSDLGADAAVVLVQALPTIMQTAYDAMTQEEA